MMAVREVARKRKFMLLILMQLLGDDPPATIEWRVWTSEWIKRREELGAYHTLFRELAAEDTLGFGEYIKMPHAKFLELVKVVGPLLTKQFRIGKSTVSQIVMEVCGVIYQVLGRRHLKTPNTVEN